MDTNALLVKSQKGVEEVESRAHGLSHRLRGALIMIDGASTLAEILERCGEFSGRVHAQILELALDGYIETVNDSGEYIDDGLGLEDKTIPGAPRELETPETLEAPAAPVDMRDFSRPVQRKNN